MLVLSCSNITKSYIIETILDSLSFTVEDGDKIGVIGLNGSGKTTLFNILAGEITQDSGEIYIQKGMKIGYLKQHTKIESEKNIFDECLEVFESLIKMEERLRSFEHEISIEGEKGESEILTTLMDEYASLSEKFVSLNGYGYKSEIRGILKGLGFKDEDFDKEVNILSGGQKSRLSLAKLLLEKPNILLLDEPTNHLDIDAISWLEKFLKDYKGASLIISHDRYFLDNVANRIFHIENLKLNIYNTNYTNFMIRRKKDMEIYKKHFEDQQREIKRQEEIIQRFKAYGGERYHGLAQSRQKMLDKMKLLAKPTGDQKRSRIKFEPKIKSGRDVLKVENLEKTFGELRLLDNINFNIYRGEKVGLIGANGIGKTTLFKIVLGQIEKDAGKIEIGHHVVSGYFDQEMSKLNLNKTIIDEIWDENPTFDYYQIRTILSQFMFIGDDIFKEISDLSGGEKGRLSLMKLMLSNANLLLMDEPTNHLDIDSKEVLEEAILDYEGTLFVISHDRYFLNRVSTKILELTKEGIKEYLGNYDYYIEKKNEVLYEEDEDDGKTKTQIKMEKKKEKEILKEEKSKRKEIINLEEKISEKEIELEDIDKELCDPSIYETPEKIVELTKKREDIQNNLDKLYNEWISLTEA
ncbi:ABC-F family ATP-binding cassette domain-containing protein [Tissierella sp.]|uniref:ABC-F family ATP-binding cassette domain-containing protein n=1 Tax=Tissierella sp. TaxID=41274 RepID=UPI0028600974|nr:ABC-F family ATP-binding cassette domain-containing protein [Tissierella sp.]MDR7856854.1 ABC-F family ATP-binding cassette domain-containing protein [Tissierella sp.]